MVKQSYDILPKIIKGGGDGMYSAEVLKGAGFPAAEGWYATIAAPARAATSPDVETCVKRFQARNTGSSRRTTRSPPMTRRSSSSTRSSASPHSGKPVNRGNVRDAIQAAKLKTLQGEVSFDENGDITNRIVSVFRIVKDDKYPDDDMIHQYKYLGRRAPANAVACRPPASGKPHCHPPRGCVR